MSLNSIIRGGVETAFAAAGDLVHRGTYTRRHGQRTYDAVNDVDVNDEIVYTNVRMIRTRATAEEREASPVSIGDVKILIPAVDTGGLPPTESDILEYHTEIYNVITHQKIPGDSLWIIMARRA